MDGISGMGRDLLSLGNALCEAEEQNSVCWGMVEACKSAG